MSFYLMATMVVTMLSTAIAIGLYNLRHMDRALKIVLLLLFVSLSSEILGIYAAYRFRNNIPVYNTYSIIEATLVCLYFNELFLVKKRKWIGNILAGIIFLSGIAYHLAYHPNNATSSIFLTIEGFLTIIFCLTYIYKTALGVMPRRYQHIWISLVFLVYWTLTMLNWVSYDYLTIALPKHKWIIDHIIFLTSLLTNLCFTILFIRLPYLNLRHGSA
ncbi:hypothetical protein [Pedobacter sp. UBA4863]|uniref:hypothetical protein n=1 Tax=Pedobacter sp. UBA4863 TaxID=1947060 RepID=UPI0025D9B138|nr:hypothetical protein [Pedobacter sp. UBA4863]